MMITIKYNTFCGCIGCWRKVNKVLSSTKGLQGRLIDKKNCLVTVMGDVDTEALIAKLAKIRKDVEVIFQGDGEDEKEEEQPKEEDDTNEKEEKPKEEAEESDKGKEKPEETIPSKSNDSKAGPSNRETKGENGTEPMGSQRLQNDLNWFNYAPNYPYGAPPYAYGHGPYNYHQSQGHGYGNGPCNYPQPQGYAYGHGPYNNPQAQGYGYGNGPYNYTQTQGYAYGDGPYNDGRPNYASQYVSDEYSSGCSIM